MAFAFDVNINPASIDASLSGGTVNDWNPTGWSTATIIWISASSPTTVNGLVGGVDGRVAILMLRSGSSNVTLGNEAAGSTATNRFGSLASGTLSTTGKVGKAMMWDGVTSRWRPF